jgi:hypothetical protein
MKLPAAAFALVLGAACGGGSHRSNNTAAAQKFTPDLAHRCRLGSCSWKWTSRPESHYSTVG